MCSIPNQNFVVVFHDGELVMPGHRICYSWFFWDFHRKYPGLPLRTTHAATGPANANLHLDLLGRCLFDCYDVYCYKGGVDLEVLSYLAYCIFNRLYNFAVQHLPEYVTSLSALDYLEIMYHPRMIEITQRLKYADFVGEQQVRLAYAQTKALLNDPAELRRNQIAKATRASAVRIGSTLQALTARGIATEADDRMFRNVITTGYAEGLETLEDVAKDSCSAKKSIMFQQRPMEQSELNNRLGQLAAAKFSTLYGEHWEEVISPTHKDFEPAMAYLLDNLTDADRVSILEKAFDENGEKNPIKRLHVSDCGSKTYMPQTISSEGHLEDFEGIFYKLNVDDPDDHSLGIVKTSDSHLIGRTILVRSVFHCDHRKFDPNACCITCYGELGLSLPRGTNVGHTSSATTHGDASQLVLSNKHEDASANAEQLRLSSFTMRYVSSNMPDKLKISRRMKARSYKMCIPISQCCDLLDLHYVDDVKLLMHTRMSCLTHAGFIVQEGDSIEQATVEIASDTRPASFTYEFLGYLKKVGWTANSDTNHYVIDMSGWDIDQQVFDIPRKQFSTPDYVASIMKLLDSGLIEYETPSQFIMALHDKLRMKLRINWSHIQSISYSSYANNPVEHDYRLPLAGTVGHPVKRSSNIKGGSITTVMAYQGQQPTIFNAKSYLVKNRPDHPLDPLIIG